MKRQIAKSSAQIESRQQAAIAKLVEDGKLEDGPEVEALKEKTAAALKANEEKIRKRVEGRIKRIQNSNAKKK